MAAALLSGGAVARPNSNVLNTLAEVQAALDAGRGHLNEGVREFTGRLTSAFVTLRKKHFP